MMVSYMYFKKSTFGMQFEHLHHDPISFLYRYIIHIHEYLYGKKRFLILYTFVLNNKHLLVLQNLKTGVYIYDNTEKYREKLQSS